MVGEGRDQWPAFNRMLKDAVRRRFDVRMCWSIDRFGRSVLHVASAMAELDAAGVALYSDQQAIDGTSPFGKARIGRVTAVATFTRPEGGRAPGVLSYCPRLPTTPRSFHLQCGTPPRNRMSLYDPTVEMDRLVLAACLHTSSTRRRDRPRQPEA